MSNRRNGGDIPQGLESLPMWVWILLLLALLGGC
jgi:hypothetical protein